MEATRLLENMRSPLHAVIAISQSIEAQEFGEIAKKYRSQAADIRAGAGAMLSVVNDSNDPVAIRSLVETCTDLLVKIVGAIKVLGLQMLGPLDRAYLAQAKRIHANVDALFDFIDLLDEFTSAEGASGYTKGDEITDIDEVILTNLRWIEPYAIANKIDLSWCPKAPGVQLRCNPLQLRQLLLSLLRNAIKYGRPGRKLDLTTELDSGGLSVILCDTGHGILVDAVTLAWTRNFVEHQRGEFTIAWMPDQGNVLRLSFPSELVNAPIQSLYPV